MKILLLSVLMSLAYTSFSQVSSEVSVNKDFFDLKSQIEILTKEVVSLKKKVNFKEDINGDVIQFLLNSLIKVDSIRKADSIHFEDKFIWMYDRYVAQNNSDQMLKAYQKLDSMRTIDEAKPSGE